MLGERKRVQRERNEERGREGEGEIGRRRERMRVVRRKVGDGRNPDRHTGREGGKGKIEGPIREREGDKKG